MFKNEQYLAAATKAADFLLENMRDGQGRLQRTYAEGQARIPAYLDDYAFLVDGLIALHQATGEKRWLLAAGELTDEQLELFWDEKVGGFYFTSDQHEDLFARSKMPTDGVTPAGNSVSVSNLVYLAAALDRPAYLERAKQTLQAGSPLLDEHPHAVPRLAMALGQWIKATQGQAAGSK